MIALIYVIGKLQNNRFLFYYTIAFLLITLILFIIVDYYEIKLPFAEYWSDCLIRLPIYNNLSFTDQDCIINLVIQFFEVQTTYDSEFALND